MKVKFLDKIYRKTYEYNNWKQQDKFNSFNEAEDEFFDMIEEARNNGMNLIDSGGDRDVYSGGSVVGNDNVVKIARESLIQNRNAVELWNEIPDGAKEHMASITKWSNNYKWIVQERCSGRGNIEQVTEKLAEYNLYVSDMNGNNIGKKEDKSVLIDLGQLKF